MIDSEGKIAEVEEWLKKKHSWYVEFGCDKKVSFTVYIICSLLIFYMPCFILRCRTCISNFFLRDALNSRGKLCRVRRDGNG
ncbi:hypothetical protein COL93_27170 [Bacillus toyonensis]|uniref:Uncharacterized protein n=1 Tax=Bacillus toyonensis TaxID=155322 RepID=A0A2C4PU15_9BACI|nr:hypothetical protein COL93_27170 [Bacillus toyonensis]PHD56327.1 hypothetical protein COF40_29650 [Bacillus toyonensis]